MGFFKRKPKTVVVRDAAEERIKILEQADARVLKNKVLQLGREVETQATLLKQTAAELRRVLEQNHG